MKTLLTLDLCYVMPGVFSQRWIYTFSPETPSHSHVSHNSPSPVCQLQFFYSHIRINSKPNTTTNLVLLFIGPTARLDLI